jgi:hypothetical protein
MEYTEDMKSSWTKRKKKSLTVQEAQAIHTARMIRAHKVKTMLMRRKEIPLRVFFITLGVSVIALILVVVNAFTYEVSLSTFIPPVFQSSTTPLEREIREMVKGYPIDDMAPFIARQDPTVAAFLVSIAKKESNWGKRVPVLDGRDCYNYWGYRGKSEEMGTGGHTCFKTRKEAVTKVAKRIETLTKENTLDTPAEMIVWKCGSNCSGHSPESVRKWISDVAFYFKQFKKTTQ